MGDPNGAQFPWGAALNINDPNQNGNSDDDEPDPEPLRPSDVKLIQIACQQTVHSGLKENKAGRLDYEALQVVLHVVGADQLP